MKLFTKTALAAALALPAVSVCAQESGALIESRAFYSTNANDAVGKPASITIDGKFNDWSEDMIVATCGANDMATAFKGSHENSVLDIYALYAAWDDKNIYLAWQMCNTGDTWAREGDGPLTDGGRIGNVPFIVTVSVDPSTPCMSGKVKDGRFIWGESKSGVTYTSHVDHLFIMSGQGYSVNAGASMFTAIDAQGNSEYDNPACCKNFSTLGVQYALGFGFQPSHLWRQKMYADYDASGKLLSDPSIVESIYDEECYDNLLGTPYPSGLKPHDTNFDTFYEMCIPMTALGIDRTWLEANGVGVRVIATRGESGIDCCPFDPSMVDNIFDSYAADKSTSHEKDDIDTISYALASVGKMRSGSVDPVPNPTPDPEPEPDPVPAPEGAWTAYFNNLGSWNKVYAYVWDANEANSDSKYNGKWPGKEMSMDAASGYFRTDVAVDDAEGKKMMIIFNNGSGTQTGDLEFKHNGIYTANGHTGEYVSGIGAAEVSAEDEVTVYYNLQGMRVANPSTGIYLVRKGDSVSKIYVH
ncbi:MAG: starch-binding protein [Muribaculaceae bacterium]|nr:starch-binding protein [Muribaculaceae bacterium]